MSLSSLAFPSSSASTPSPPSFASPLVFLGAYSFLSSVISILPVNKTLSSSARSLLPLFLIYILWFDFFRATCFDRSNCYSMILFILCWNQYFQLILIYLLNLEFPIALLFLAVMYRHAYFLSSFHWFIPIPYSDYLLRLIVLFKLLWLIWNLREAKGSWFVYFSSYFFFYCWS